MGEVSILVVEDSPTTQKTLETFLIAQEARVEAVLSGEEAFEMLEQGLLPSLIILDINLPGMGGGDVLEKLRMDARWRHIPVIPFSALWNETSDEPFRNDLHAVKKWLDAADLSEEVQGGPVAPVTPKYDGEEETLVVHPKLIVTVAKTLIDLGHDLTPSFRHLVRLSQCQLGKSE